MEVYKASKLLTAMQKSNPNSPQKSPKPPDFPKSVRVTLAELKIYPCISYNPIVCTLIINEKHSVFETSRFDFNENRSTFAMFQHLHHFDHFELEHSEETITLKVEMKSKLKHINAAIGSVCVPYLNSFENIFVPMSVAIMNDKIQIGDAKVIIDTQGEKFFSNFMQDPNNGKYDFSSTVGTHFLEEAPDVQNTVNRAAYRWKKKTFTPIAHADVVEGNNETESNLTLMRKSRHIRRSSSTEILLDSLSDLLVDTTTTATTVLTKLWSPVTGISSNKTTPTAKSTTPDNASQAGNTELLNTLSISGSSSTDSTIQNSNEKQRKLSINLLPSILEFSKSATTENHTSPENKKDLNMKVTMKRPKIDESHTLTDKETVVSNTVDEVIVKANKDTTVQQKDSYFCTYLLILTLVMYFVMMLYYLSGHYVSSVVDAQTVKTVVDNDVIMQPSHPQSQSLQLKTTLEVNNVLQFKHTDQVSVRVQFKDTTDGLCLMGNKKWYSKLLFHHVYTLKWSECTDESWWRVTPTLNTSLTVKHHNGQCLFVNTWYNGAVRLNYKDCTQHNLDHSEWSFQNGRLQLQIQSSSLCVARKGVTAMLLPCEIYTDNVDQTVTDGVTNTLITSKDHNSDGTVDNTVPRIVSLVAVMQTAYRDIDSNGYILKTDEISTIIVE